MQYIAFIHKNAGSSPVADEWTNFFEAATATGMFKGGSAIGSRMVIGQKPTPETTQSVAGYMRFDSDDLEELTALLNKHPVIKHGGTIELCELPETG